MLKKLSLLAAMVLMSLSVAAGAIIPTFTCTSDTRAQENGGLVQTSFKRSEGGMTLVTQRAFYTQGGEMKESTFRSEMKCIGKEIYHFKCVNPDSSFEEAEVHSTMFSGTIGLQIRLQKGLEYGLQSPSVLYFTMSECNL